MKINIVLGHTMSFPSAKGGGIENLYLLLSRQFAGLGHEVVVYSRAWDGYPDAETDEHRVRHVRLPGFDWTGKKTLDAINSLRWCLRLRRRLEHADVTLFNTLFSFLVLLRPQYGVAISTIHRTPKRRIRLFKSFDRIYAGSDAVVEQARAVAPELKNLKRIYNCVSLPQQRPSLVSRPRGNGLLFTYVGRFVRDKGLEYLVKGFAESLVDYPRNKLLTLGPQTDREGADSAFFAQMQSFVQQRKLTDSIAFHPPIYEREALMGRLSEADVVCVPTVTGETFSMAILEAMAMGKPVLTSDFGPMPEAVDHLETGYVSKVADSASIAEGIRFFSADPSRIDTLSKRAWEKVQEFSVEGIAQEYLDDFSVLLQKRRARRDRSA